MVWKLRQGLTAGPGLCGERLAITKPVAVSRQQTLSEVRCPSALHSRCDCTLNGIACHAPALTLVPMATTVDVVAQVPPFSLLLLHSQPPPSATADGHVCHWVARPPVRIKSRFADNPNADDPAPAPASAPPTSARTSAAAAVNAALRGGATSCCTPHARCMVCEHVLHLTLKPLHVPWSPVQPSPDLADRLIAACMPPQFVTNAACRMILSNCASAKSRFRSLHSHPLGA